MLCGSEEVKAVKKEKNLTQLRNYLIEEKEEVRGGAWAAPPAREGHGCGCKAVTCGLETSSSGVTASVPGLCTRHTSLNEPRSTAEMIF